MNASELINEILKICVENDVSADELEVYFRQDMDSDVLFINAVSEDMYDDEHNSRLTSIILYTDDEPR